MNRLLAVGALLLLMGAADISNLDRVMGALAERKHGHVSFTEKKFIAVLDKPVESSGELLYDAPDRLAHLPAIEACHSVAGDESYILKVRVASPSDLESLLQEIRAAANVSTRTSVVLSTPYEGRPPAL